MGYYKYMFDYSIKTKAIFISAIVISIIALIFLLNYENSRNRDLIMVSQIRGLATSMEKYFDKNNAYPEISKTKLDNIEVITENGFNQEGDYIYFYKSDWSKDGTIVSTKDLYAIDFELDNSWDLWGIKGSGKCRISNYLKMECLSK